MNTLGRDTVKPDIQKRTDNKGILLEDLTWQEAEKVLDENTIVVIPLGAQSKEHGPHLKLKNDFLLAEYYKNRILKETDVVVLPTVNYHYYPAFVEYPGSITLGLETARDIIIDIVNSVARFGVKKFYVLNTGVSTNKPLELAKQELEKAGIIFFYTKLEEMSQEVKLQLQEQEGGTHADELETSAMLYIASDTVDMSKAVKDYTPKSGLLTRDPNNPKGTYSPTGIWGNPTLASKSKGKLLVESFVKDLLEDIQSIRNI